MKMLLRLMMLIALVLGGTGAHAAITCTSLTSAGFTTAYVPNSTVSLQLSFTITCNRGSTSDPTSLSYSVKADNGVNQQGNSNANRAALTLGGTTSYINYDVYTPSCGTTQWKNNVTISGTVNWTSTQTGNSTDSQPFWGCIVLAQNPTAAGSYTDTITITATYNPGTGNTTVAGTVPVTIYAPANCVINPAPGNVNITYPAFSVSPVSSTTTFGATCTSPMPYSLAVSPVSGTLAGVNYNVTLSAASATGSGTLQTYTITVTAPPGQGGTCAGATCTATQTHTLTVTY